MSFGIKIGRQSTKVKIKLDIYIDTRTHTHTLTNRHEGWKATGKKKINNRFQENVNLMEQNRIICTGGDKRVKMKL